jgi:hypothetical protein
MLIFYDDVNVGESRLAQQAGRIEMTERWRRKQHAHANHSKIDKAFFTRIASLRRSGSPLEGHLGVPWEANTMHTAKARVVVLTLGMTLFGVVSHAAAEDSPKRDATIEKCIARAHREYPDPGEAEAYFRARSAVYKACMAENGEVP